MSENALLATETLGGFDPNLHFSPVLGFQIFGSLQMYFTFWLFRKCENLLVGRMNS